MLHVGMYTEIRFPEMGIRFIAVSDGVDSENDSSNDFTPFRNIINEEISAPDGFVTNSEIHTVVLAATFDTVSVTEYWTGTAWSSTNGEGYKAATYDTEILKSYSVSVDGNTVSSYTFTNESTSNSNDIKWTTLDPVELPCQLVNTKGVELPHTGGIGTTIFYVVGIVLVLGAAAIIIARRKAEQE